MLVAILVVFAIPISQLRTVEVVTEACCCPDPANCHCPPQSPVPTGEPQLKTCHRVSHDVVAPQLPAFSPPDVAFVQPGLRVTAALVIGPAALHPAPASRRPDVPS